MQLGNYDKCMFVLHLEYDNKPSSTLPMNTFIHNFNVFSKVLKLFTTCILD
jgi:hypothetical protein